MEDLLSTHEEEDKTPFDLMWAAGFLEGEGSFTISKDRKRPRITAGQVKKAPLETLQRVFGCGRLYLKQREEVSDVWEFSIYTPKEVVEVGRKLLPLMHERRKEQLREVLRVAETTKSHKRWLGREEARAIYKLTEKGDLTHKEIGERFDIGQPAVTRIANKETYLQHIGDL